MGCLGQKKRNGNKGDVFGTHSVTKTSNSLKTDKSMTAIPTNKLNFSKLAVAK